MSESGHCADCQRPIRFVRVQFNGAPIRIPLDYAKTPEGDYSVVGPETAFFIEEENRFRWLNTGAPLYTDHRRTCPMKKGDVDPDRPLFSKVTITCNVCGHAFEVGTTVEVAKECVLRFTDQHLNCRGRKAS